MLNGVLAGVAASVVSPGITASGTNVQLAWTGGQANVYRAADDPYFTPGAAVATGVSSIWTDGGATGNPAANYTLFFAVSTTAGESGNSQRLGEFDLC